MSFCGGRNHKTSNRNFHKRTIPVHVTVTQTRQHSYRKEDRAMRPIDGCSEKF